MVTEWLTGPGLGWMSPDRNRRNTVITGLREVRRVEQFAKRKYGIGTVLRWLN